jgi:hypothetical protein
MKLNSFATSVATLSRTKKEPNTWQLAPLSKDSAPRDVAQLELLLNLKYKIIFSGVLMSPRRVIAAKSLIQFTFLLLINTLVSRKIR